MENQPKKTNSNRFQKCEPTQAKLKFQEAYRAIRSLNVTLDCSSFPFGGYQARDQAEKSIQLMIDAMPYKKAVYFESAKEAASHFQVFESQTVRSRLEHRALFVRGAVIGMMPEVSLAQREQEACF